MALWSRDPLDRTLLGFRPTLARQIERRFGGWRHQYNEPDPARPERLETPKRVAVIGGGLAGFGAASLLAERGYEVVLIEKQETLGGKIRAWRQTLSDGSEAMVEHGFHAFFRHYYNLTEFLERLGIYQELASIEDYLILGLDGKQHGFLESETVPVLNIMGLARQGVFKWRDVLLSPAVKHMDVLLRYNPETTFDELDDLSFAEFARIAELPRGLMLSFNTFARAFFAEEDRMSMAELVKSFHFYYLSQPAGLLYEYPVADYNTAVVNPILAHLTERGVAVRPGTSVVGIDRDGERFVVRTEGPGSEATTVDAVVLATDVVGARAVAEGAPWLDEASPEVAGKLKALEPSQRYAVLRIWTDTDLPEDMPLFVITERRRALDAIALYHRFDPDCAAWAKPRGGAVLELHCYAVPDDLEEEAIHAQMLEELAHFFPHTRGQRIIREYMQINKNFSAFHVGMRAARPVTETGVPGFYLAGDWVKLGLPVMLMEAAYTSGVLAANAVLRESGLREQQVWSVPPRGIMDGVPKAPWAPSYK